MAQAPAPQRDEGACVAHFGRRGRHGTHCTHTLLTPHNTTPGGLVGRCYFAPVGFFMCLFHRNDAKYFLVLYAIVAYFFSLKMVRRPFLPLPAPPSLRVCVPGAWRLPPPYATPHTGVCGGGLQTFDHLFDHLVDLVRVCVHVCVCAHVCVCVCAHTHTCTPTSRERGGVCVFVCVRARARRRVSG